MALYAEPEELISGGISRIALPNDTEKSSMASLWSVRKRKQRAARDEDKEYIQHLMQIAFYWQSMYRNALSALQHYEHGQHVEVPEPQIFFIFLRGHFWVNELIGSELMS